MKSVGNVGAVQESLKTGTIFSQLTRTTPFCLSSHYLHIPSTALVLCLADSSRRLQAIRKTLVSNNLLNEHS